jgi:hypothetical protein
MRRFIVALLLAALGLGVGGVWALTRFYDPTPGPHEAIGLVPPDALSYVHLSLDPSNVQKKALRRILSRFTEDGSFEETKDSVGKLLDPFLSQFGLSYEDDVDPWLGDEVAMFFTAPTEGSGEPEAAVMMATEDVAAARRAARAVGRRTSDGTGGLESYRGVRYEVFRSAIPSDTVAFTVLDGFLVLGSVEGLRDAIDASSTESLSEDDGYELVVDPLHDDHLVSVYVDTPGILEQVPLDPEIIGTVDALRLREGAGIGAFSLRVEGDGAVLEASSTVGDGFGRTLASAVDGESPLSDLPADAWFATGVPKLEPLVTSVLDLVASTGDGDFERDFADLTGVDLSDDVLDWAEDGSLFLTGDTLLTLGGAVVVGSSDPSATVAVVDAIGARIEAEFSGSRAEVEREGLQGFDLRGLTPAPITVLAGERLIAAYGGIAAGSAVSPEETLGATDLFRRAEAALGSGQEPLIFIDLKAARELVEANLPGFLRGPYERDVKRFLTPLSYAVAGIERRDEVLFQRLIVGVE